MVKQVAKLDYFSFAKRDDEGYHWDLSDGKKRIATIRGGPPTMYTIYFDGEPKLQAKTGTLKGAFRYLLRHFVELDP